MDRKRQELETKVRQELVKTRTDELYEVLQTPEYNLRMKDATRDMIFGVFSDLETSGMVPKDVFEMVSGMILPQIEGSFNDPKTMYP